MAAATWRAASFGTPARDENSFHRSTAASTSSMMARFHPLIKRRARARSARDLLISAGVERAILGTFILTGSVLWLPLKAILQNNS
jgi:hypothetical protein